LQWQTSSGGPPADPNFALITIRELLQHISGIPESNSFSEPGVAQTLNDLEGLGISPPITQNDMREFVVANPELTYTNPGSGAPWPAASAQYSNLGYWILARVVEELSGDSFVTYLQNSVAAPLGASRIRLMTDAIADQPADEARYYDKWSEVGVPQWYWPSVDELAPFSYGVYTTSLYDGSGGLSVAPVDYARIMASLNVRNGNPVLTPASIDNILSNSYGFDGSPYSPVVPPLPSPYVVDKGGLISGTQSVVLFNQGGMSYVAFWDRDDVYFYDPNWYPVFQELVNAINAANFGSVDYFPTFGMPSFSLPLTIALVGKNYLITSSLNGTLQYSTSLFRPAWTDVGPITTDTPVNIAVDSAISARFYRLRMP